MTEETTTDQPEQMVDQTPALHKREPRDIVPFNAGGGMNAMIPQTPEEYARMANLLGQAGCVPASYKGATVEETRAKLIIGLMKSVEIGVGPITGLNGIMIVNNRPSVWGDLAMSLVHRSGQLERMDVRKVGAQPTPNLPLDQWDDAFGYTVTMWRKGQESAYSATFTVGDARRAVLWLNHKKEPWIKYPEDMLFNRARARCMARGFADALHGMGIVEEERDIAPEVEHKPNTAALLSDEPEESEYEEVLEPESGGTAQSQDER